MAQGKITKKWLKNHWAYSWWKYLLLTVLCVMGVNVLFTTTAYRPPEEKKIEVYFTSGYIDSAAIQADFEPVFFEHLPEQELISLMNVNLAGDDPYTRMQYTTYIGAQQGDIFVLSEKEVLNLTDGSDEGALIDLAPYLDSGVIDVSALEGELLKLTKPDGTQGVFGIPADSLRGLEQFYFVPANSYLCVAAFSCNEDTAAAVINLLIERYIAEAAPAQETAVPAVIF